MVFTAVDNFTVKPILIKKTAII